MSRTDIKEKSTDAIKKGDLVVCIGESEVGSAGKIGELFLVSELTPTKSLNFVGEKQTGNMPSRFKTVEDAGLVIPFDRSIDPKTPITQLDVDDWVLINNCWHRVGKVVVKNNSAYDTYGGIYQTANIEAYVKSKERREKEAFSSLFHVGDTVNCIDSSASIYLNVHADYTVLGVCRELDTIKVRGSAGHEAFYDANLFKKKVVSKTVDNPKLTGTIATHSGDVTDTVNTYAASTGMYMTLNGWQQIGKFNLINSNEDVKMATPRRVVTVELFDDSKGLPVEDSLVAEFPQVVTEDDNDTTIREVIMNNELKDILALHNSKREKVINLDILERTGNKVTLQPVKLKDLRWNVKS